VDVGVGSSDDGKLPGMGAGGGVALVGCPGGVTGATGLVGSELSIIDSG
jgi:hypothetical protein